MRHIDKIIIKQATDSRAASSCGSDIDRQELINNYGNEEYLSKWGHEGQESLLPIDNKATDKHKQGESQTNEGNIPTDDDNASLVSYNSVRDGTPLTKSTAYLPYQVNQPNQDITLWQGYGGNIYFDSVRCRAVRINSSKPNKKKTKEKPSTHRLTKSCSPSMEFHALNSSHFITYSASSFHSLGSLRIASREEKKKRTPLRTQSQYCKLRKGFVETDDRYNIRRSRSTPESLVISGGHMNSKTDPIDSVYRLNTKFRLLSKGRGSNLNDHQNLPSLIGGEHKVDTLDDVKEAEKCTEQSTRLPRVDQSTASSRISKDVSEPTPVFIIPFATLDDPVEVDTNSTPKQEKRDSIKNEKEITKTVQKPVKQVTVQNTNKPVLQKPVKLEKSPQSANKPEDCKVCKLQQANAVTTHIVNITGESNSPQVSPRYDFQIRREISNSSLSNYLQAVPKNTKTIKVPKEHKKTMPRLTYTQRMRTSESSPADLESDDTFNEQPVGLTKTSALYGGYLPSTRATHNFYVELRSDTSAPSEASTVTSPSRDERHRVTKSILKRTGLKGNEKELVMNKNCQLPVIGWNVS